MTGLAKTGLDGIYVKFDNNGNLNVSKDRNYG